MHYDLVLSDFDGTLLRWDDTVSPRTVKAIGDFVAAGGVFGISTGRSYASIVQRLGEVGLCGNFPVMSCQGALSRDSKSGKTIAEIPLERAAAVEFLRRAEDLGLMAQFYTADEIYAPEVNESNEEYFRINRMMPVTVGKVSVAAAIAAQPILKVLCIIDPADRERILRQMEGIAGAKVFASHAMLIEAVSAEAGKGNGLRLTCERFGIDLRRSAAFGDELNDVEMLEAAGLGVAMGNAVPAAKRSADIVTEDCDCDGVAIVLEKIVRGEL